MFHPPGINAQFPRHPIFMAIIFTAQRQPLFDFQFMPEEFRNMRRGFLSAAFLGVPGCLSILAWKVAVRAGLIPEATRQAVERVAEKFQNRGMLFLNYVDERVEGLVHLAF